MQGVGTSLTTVNRKEILESPNPLGASPGGKRRSFERVVGVFSTRRSPWLRGRQHCVG